MTDNILVPTDGSENSKQALDRAVELAKPLDGGIPYRQILDYADEHDIDMIVMGTHGRTGLGRALIGSVTERTLRGSSHPVLAVPPAE